MKSFIAKEDREKEERNRNNLQTPSAANEEEPSLCWTSLCSWVSVVSPASVLLAVRGRLTPAQVTISPAVLRVARSFTSAADRTAVAPLLLTDGRQMLPQMLLIGTSACPSRGGRDQVGTASDARGSCNSVRFRRFAISPKYPDWLWTCRSSRLSENKKTAAELYCKTQPFYLL